MLTESDAALFDDCLFEIRQARKREVAAHYSTYIRPEGMTDEQAYSPVCPELTNLIERLQKRLSS